jgi:thiol-disulfide isomerase/thioredoxin
MMSFPFAVRAWRGLFTLFAACLAACLLAACGSSEPAGNASGNPTAAAALPITLADLPAGLGRGYPVATVEGATPGGGLLQAGVAAPDFAMVLEDGRALRLSDLQGKPVVINFWATWCGPCRMEMPDLVQAAQDENLVVLAVDVQEARSAVEDFADEFQMTMPVVLDSEGKLRNLYGVPGLPTTYFVGADGAIAALVVGPLTPQVLADRLAELQ